MKCDACHGSFNESSIHHVKVPREKNLCGYCYKVHKKWLAKRNK